MELNGPPPIGAAKANLTAEAEQYMQEVALNEQVSFLPCVTFVMLSAPSGYRMGYGVPFGFRNMSKWRP